MIRTILTYLLLTAFIVAVVFGLYLNFGHAMDGGGCMYSMGEMALCSIPLVQLERWQSIVSTVLLDTLMLFALGATLLVVRGVLDPTPHSQERYRLRRGIPDTPPSLQELFSNGILHPKVF